jgi:hypothetical protein
MRLQDAWRAVLLAGETLIEMDAQYEERQEYLHRAHLLVRIRQSRLIVEVIALYSIKVV